MQTAKRQPLPPPPNELRPWYYHNLFLFFTFVMGWLILWPVWPVIIIRSPWHNGIISGGLAWAMLLTGGFRLVEQMKSNPTTAVMLLLPGVALTVMTQVLWSKHKQALPAAAPAVAEDATQASPPDTSGVDSPGSASDGTASDGTASDERDTPRLRRNRVRRRTPRGRSSRPGRRPPSS